MSDRRRPDGPDQDKPPWSEPTQQLGYTDPAYSGQYTYPSYVPPSAPDPTDALPPYWTQTAQYPPPPGTPPGQTPPPGPPKSPRWLWIVAGLAVLLVVGLVIALVIANGSSKDDTVVAPLPPLPDPSGSSSPSTTTTRSPSTTRSTEPRTTAAVPPTTSDTSAPGATETVVYTVTGQGRAISITYVDEGGVLQMEFNVVLPWTRQVSLSAPASNAASVTVLNVGREVTCSVSVDGAQVRERTGTGLTICASVG
ncbi:MmpS family transport accessory protein [soil metagenome]